MKRLRILLPLIWMVVIFYFSSIPNLELTGNLSTYDLILRKLAHITEYTILAFLWWFSLPKKDNRTRAIFAITISVLYAFSDELHQHYVYSRDGKILDVLTDSVGVTIGTFLGYYNDKRKSFSKKEDLHN